MRERINRLARGIVDGGVPGLMIKPERLEGSFGAGQTVKGEFLVQSTNDLYIKGLVYSSNERVRAVNEAFGGLRSHIIYEVDTRCMEDGDEIKGSFYLVTNGGEREIPYSLRIQTGTGGEELASLKTARDFANLARKNTELALRLFEYQDFIQAPFMQEPEARSIYEGLRGRNGRKNLLEEFLVALHVKEPVRISTDTSPRCYRDLEEEKEDFIELALSGWGYKEAVLQAEGAFISLETSSVTDRDFTENRCQIPYRILPDALHGGKNMGRIVIRTPRREFVIPIEAERRKRRDPYRETAEDKKGFLEYIQKRLLYELAASTDREWEEELLQETEKLRILYPKDGRVRLLRAEHLMLSGRRDTAQAALEEVREEVLKEQEKMPWLYCYYEYLCLLLNPSESRKEELIRYIRKLLWEKGSPSPWLLLLLIRTDETCLQNPLDLYRSMEMLFANGCRSPFLYGRACRLLTEHPVLFLKLGAFELQVLQLGIREGLLDRETVLKAADFISAQKYYRKPVWRLAKQLYEAYPERKLLEAVCGLLIRGEQKTGEAFLWYEKAQEAHINITRLYEYFLYSLPDDYNRLLPKEVLLYFSYDKTLDREHRCILYRNILLYMNPSSELYQSYIREMEQFAMEQLFALRIDSRLAVIYEHMIYQDMIDERAAKVLPAILCSRRIICEEPGMKYVVVRCEELQDEETYALEKGEAYVPARSGHMILMFQDAYGNRYLDVKHRKYPVMDKKELLDRCAKLAPDHPMLLLRACCQVMGEGIHTLQEAHMLDEAAHLLRLNPVSETRLREQVVEFYCRMEEDDREDKNSANCACLVQMDKEDLSEKARKRICETLIGQDFLREAYDMICRFKITDIDVQLLSRLCSRMILQQLFDQDDWLLSFSYRVFEAGKADSVVLDYLCEHFNGTVSQMYGILIRGVQEHIETYDLEERLLAQMLFTGCCDRIDSVFDLYMSRKKTRESIVKAYFTEKCAQYFLEGKEMDPKVFDYLKKAARMSLNREKLPTLYLLSLTKYFAGIPEISPEDKELLLFMTRLLLEQRLIFPYTRDLSRHIPVPEDILDKTMVEYHGDRDRAPWMEVRLLPEETSFHREEMRRVYQGIYVKEMVLFEGETLEYQIYERESRGRVLTAEGRLTCDHKLDGRENSRFACLNRMGAALKEKNEEKLAGAMEDYLKRSAVLGSLFPVKE
nr:DUF5717 family protein [uncultured Enterocloster sp.]